MEFVDAYNVQARFAPFALVASPPALLAICTAVVDPNIAIGGALGTCAVFIGAQLGRDRGKRLEPGLWQSWGGAPTTQRLRYRGADQAKVERAHADVEAATQLRLPSAAEEAEDLGNADRAYVAAIAALRELTRDRSSFDLLFKENVQYGFRRNLLGLKGVGILVAVAVIVVSAAVVVLGTDQSDLFAAVGVPVIWSLLTIAMYLAVVTPSWVRVPAEAYADRLIGAAGVLARQSSTGV